MLMSLVKSNRVPDRLRDLILWQDMLLMAELQIGETLQGEVSPAYPSGVPWFRFITREQACFSCRLKYSFTIYTSQSHHVRFVIKILYNTKTSWKKVMKILVLKFHKPVYLISLIDFTTKNYDNFNLHPEVCHERTCHFEVDCNSKPAEHMISPEIETAN